MCFICCEAENVKIKTRRTTLLCYTMLYTPNAFGYLAFFRVVPEAVSGFLIYNTLIIGQVIDIDISP